MTRTYVLATANPDKAVEVEEILLDVLGDAIELLPRPGDVPDVDETGETLTDNARLKAHALATATGAAVIADDTGLEVDALGGAPGVYSARFAGEGASYADNVAKLLTELETLDAVEPSERTARFTTVALARLPDGSEILATGQVEGRIARRPRGEGGFGYDCVFVPDGGGGRTFAEMSPEEKHDLSHRGRAFRALAERLAEGGTA
ncbi:MAG TPA: RdgB/HAM1 family non-canonical purine NTP pyrophosphatase [Acidimicrobiales bacterium]|nr:RdgB/HAM1 family non-canonical purine NTP pyrophosphatase [Acidimicrobiales bacterium]